MFKVPSTVKAVAIQNYGPSGSLFLQSLLDGHPRLLSLPALYMRAFYPFWEEHGLKPRAAVIDAFLRENEHWFKPGGVDRGHGLEQMGESMQEDIHIDGERFRSILEDLLGGPSPFNRRTMLLSVYLAYGYARGLEIPPEVYVVFPIHSLPRGHAAYLAEDFKDVRFIHMIREPIELMGSLIKHIFANALPVNALECAFSQIIADYSQHWGWRRYVYGDRFFFSQEASAAVRLEDLHARPRETLEAVCRWLDIPFNECLLVSTFNGKKWWNRPESPRVSGFGGAVAGRRHENWFNRFDKARLYGVLAAKYQLWNYPAPAWTQSTGFRLIVPILFFAPFKVEFFCALRHGMDWGRAIPPRLRELLHSAGWVLRYSKWVVPDQGRRRAIKGWLSAHAAPAIFLSLVLLSPFLIISAPFFLLRDYLRIRWWLWRGWRESFYSPRPEVRLISS